MIVRVSVSLPPAVTVIEPGNGNGGIVPPWLQRGVRIGADPAPSGALLRHDDPERESGVVDGYSPEIAAERGGEEMR
jgi:hypothetical protein